MRFLKLIGFLFIVMSLIGCSETDKEQSDQAVSLMEEKFDEKFVATHIGGRYGTASNDTITTIIHPEGKENVTFKVITTKDGELVANGYIGALISEQINAIMKKELEPFGIESESLTVSVNGSRSKNVDSSVTIDEYVDVYQPEYFSGQMIVKDTGDIKGEHFEQALLNVYETAKERMFQIRIGIFTEEEYEEAVKEYRKLTEPDPSFFRDYNLVDEIDAVADANGYNFIFHSDPRYGK